MMNRSFFRAAVLAALFPVSLPCVAFAQTAPVQLRPADQGWVSRIEDTLGKVTTLQAHFRQTAADGSVTTGTATLDRPGRMRFDYDKPSPLLLVANDGRVVFQDRSVDQVTTLPLDRTPLGLLLRPEFKLSGDVTVKGFEHRDGQIRIQLVRTQSAGEGSLTLVFSDAPLSLEGWSVVDAQGRTTTIALSDVHLGGDVPQSLFVLPKAD
ncbi:LolA family protein [Gluconobacter kondonii]|uniref:LolA family protein n=1 Tax=Gluconobacter kondonii TaxID=941463 RepID=UPI00197F3A80|nr:outer membrane lipoprotein carrier protein LolA [Gluconobacter kondonii]MBN3866287.1 outer membrane lipoprotein carrier protein LolA [Gluconobacter kondonii]